MITLKQLLKFQKIRNKSGFASNMQFMIDANHAGFEPADLGDPKPFRVDGFKGYLWTVPLKGGETIRVVEFGSLHVEGHPSPNEDAWADGRSVDMFNLLDEKAVWLEAAA